MKFDSNDELYFQYWLEELSKTKLITNIESVIQSIQLSEEVKLEYLENKKKKTITLIKAKYYTPDFIFKCDDSLTVDVITENETKQLTPLFIASNGIVYVDIKGAYTKHYGSSMTFPDRQAMVYMNHNIYVNKIIVHDNIENSKCLFARTFVPKKVQSLLEYKIKSKKGTSKIKYKFLNCQEWINSIQLNE